MAANLRELTFQNVVDTILVPKGVKVGGYPDEIFMDLTDMEREKWSCSICFLILKDPRFCDNKHHFCHTCIFAWSLTLGTNSQKCPVCRGEQQKYEPATEMRTQIGQKRVKCPEIGCSFASPLRILLLHTHGKLAYSNDHVDLESLRPPPQQMFMRAAQHSLPLRSQLMQGRMMVNQMLMLLRLEMELRQHALLNFTQSRDHRSRMHHADEMIALNEQLTEVGGILGHLVGASIMEEPDRRPIRRPSPRISNGADSTSNAQPSTTQGVSNNEATNERSQTSRILNRRSSEQETIYQNPTQERNIPRRTAELTLVFRHSNPDSGQSSSRDGVSSTTPRQSTPPTVLPPINSVESRPNSRQVGQTAQNNHSSPSSGLQRPDSQATIPLRPTGSGGPTGATTSLLPSRPTTSEQPLREDREPEPPAQPALPDASGTYRRAMQVLGSDSMRERPRSRRQLITINSGNREMTNLENRQPTTTRVNTATDNRTTTITDTDTTTNANVDTTTITTINNETQPALNDTGRETSPNQQGSSFAPQRRFRRDNNNRPIKNRASNSNNQSNRPSKSRRASGPIRASHDIDVDNMAQLANSSAANQGGQAKVKETSERGRRDSNDGGGSRTRRASVTGESRPAPRESSPVPRPRRRSEIREEMLKSRTQRSK